MTAIFEIKSNASVGSEIPGTVVHESALIFFFIISFAKYSSFVFILSVLKLVFLYVLIWIALRFWLEMVVLPTTNIPYV